MAGPNTWSGDNTFRDGAVNMAGCTSVTLPANALGDSQITAASPLGVTKVRRRFNKGYAQVKGSAAADETGRVIHVAYGASGTVVAVRAGVLVAAVGDSTVTVDVKKNGTTILSGVITIDNGNAAYAEESGTVSVPALASGDVIEVVIDATVGTGTLPQGLYVDVVIDEDPA